LGGDGGGSVEVEIPLTLYRRLERLASGSGFSDVGRFIVYLLREAASRIEEDMLSSSELNDEEKREIVERLRRLGYL